jgi:hypothetical protein
MRRGELPAYLRQKFGITRSVSSFARLAVLGNGPPFYRAGRQVLYDPDDADVWARELLGKARSSTSEHRAGRPVTASTREAA